MAQQYGRFRVERQWLDPLRSTTRFRALLADAEARYRKAAEAFARAGGESLIPNH
jgi:hypothetical protein